PLASGTSNPVSSVRRPVMKLFDPHSHSMILKRMDRAVRGKAMPADAIAVVHLNSASFDYEMRVSRLDNGDGPAVAITLHDVTERRQIELQLRANEERLRLAFAGAREGVWDWHLETGHVVYSHRWKELLGFDDDELAPTVKAWEALLHPADRPRAADLHDAVQQGQEQYEAEFRLRHKDGHYVTVLTRGLPIRREPGGAVVRIVGTHLDITEQKRTEQ